MSLYAAGISIQVYLIGMILRDICIGILVFRKRARHCYILYKFTVFGFQCLCDDMLLFGLLIWGCVALSRDQYQDAMANEDTCPGCDAFWIATLINVVIGMCDVTISPCFVICMFKKPELRK